jgi:homoserine dehydrogenase
VADLLDAAYSVVHGVRERLVFASEARVDVTPIEQLETRYYVRLTVNDRPGVLAQIARVFGDASISIGSVIQMDRSEVDHSAELVFMTDEANEGSMRQALADVESLPVVTEVGTFLRVEGVAP